MEEEQKKLSEDQNEINISDLNYVQTEPKIELAYAECLKSPDKMEITKDILIEIVIDSIEKAAKEIEKPVINRVIPIALVTTKQLILKDFAFEADADKMQKAMYSTAQSLASQLS